MKKTVKMIAVFVIACAASVTSLRAQAPNAIPYQAVARNSSGNLIASQNISLRFSIHDATANGTIVYQETQTVTTNLLGLFSVNIGQGTPVSGNLTTINWGTGAKFTQVEMDAAGGTAYIDMGTQQMMSVPFALYAAHSNDAGPAGATGDMGPMGPMGAMGATGATGANGMDGTNGSNGTNGLAGATGAQGIAGATGANGMDGTNGSNGTNGVAGATGATGATGANGTNGINGLTGATGATGSVGSVTAISGTSNANGATIDTGGNLTLTPADATNGGVVTTGAQTFAGNKTFTGNATANSFVKTGGTSSQYLMADGSVTAAPAPINGYPFMPIQNATNTAAPGTKSYWYIVRVNRATTINGIQFYLNSGTDVFRCAIYRGGLQAGAQGSITLVGQSGPQSCFSGDNSAPIFSQSNQNLTFAAGEYMTIAFHSFGTTNIYYQSSPLTVLNTALAYTSAANYALIGFPSFLTQSSIVSGISSRICFELY